MTEQERMQLQALRIQLVAAVAQIDCMTGPPDHAEVDGETLPEFYGDDRSVGMAAHS